jgi:hypothetical protein
MVPNKDLWGGEADGGVAVGGSGREGADATGGVGDDIFGGDAVGGEVFGDVARASKGEFVVDFGGAGAAISGANDVNFQSIFDGNSGNLIEVYELRIVAQVTLAEFKEKENRGTKTVTVIEADAVGSGWYGRGVWRFGICFALLAETSAEGV